MSTPDETEAEAEAVAETADVSPISELGVADEDVRVEESPEVELRHGEYSDVCEEEVGAVLDVDVGWAVVLTAKPEIELEVEVEVEDAEEE